MHWLIGVLLSTQWIRGFLSNVRSPTACHNQTSSKRPPRVASEQGHFPSSNMQQLRCSRSSATHSAYNTAREKEGGSGGLFIDRIRPGRLIISLQVNDDRCANFCLLLQQSALDAAPTPLYAHLPAAHECGFYLENFINLPSYQRASLWSCV